VKFTARTWGRLCEIYCNNVRKIMLNLLQEYGEDYVKFTARTWGREGNQREINLLQQQEAL
jgi:hypothetical protein